jgi:hypothetical protein
MEEEDKIEGIDVQIEMEDVLIDPPVVPPEDGIAELKKQLDRERALRIEAERKANDAQLAEHAARMDKEDSDIQLVSNAIDTLERDQEQLKRALAHAIQTGDGATAAAVQEEMGSNSAKLMQLQNGLQAMKSQPKPQPPKPVVSDPVEAFASQLSPRSADWVRAHPEFVRDPAKTRKMIAAHELAVADGIAPDSDAYFEAIEATLRVRPQAQVQAHEEDAMAGAAKVTQRRDAAPAAAPVSRGQPSRNTVRLTAAEREMAEMMNMKPEEYARNKLALQKEGKLQ